MLQARARYASLDFAVNIEKSSDIYQQATHRVPMVFGENVYVPAMPILSRRLEVINDRLVEDRISLISLGQLANSDVGEVRAIDIGIYQHGQSIDTWIGLTTGIPTQTAYPNPHGTIAKTYQVRGVTIPLTEVETFYGVQPVIDSYGMMETAPGVWVQVPLPSTDVSYATYITAIPTDFVSLATGRSILPIRNCCDFQSNLDALVLGGKTHRRIISAGIGRITTALRDEAVIQGATHLIDASLKTLYDLTADLPLFTDDTFWYTYQISTATQRTRYPDVINYLASARSGGLNQQINPDVLFDYPSFVTANQHADAQVLYFNGVICSSLFQKGVEFRHMINTHAKWFDLIPFRRENRLGFYPATLNSARLLHLFTPLNQREYERKWLDFVKHQLNNAHVEYCEPTAHDYIGLQSLSNVAVTDAYVTELYSAVPVQNDRVSLALQLPRIVNSINVQSQCIRFFTTWSQLPVEIGDFMVVADPSDNASLDIMGGIRGTSLVTTGNLYPIDFNFEIDRNTATTESQGNYTYAAGVPVLVGDWLVNQSQRIYGQVTGITNNPDGTTTATIIKQRYNRANDTWEAAPDPFLINQGDAIILISLAVSSPSALFYEDVGDSIALRTDTVTLSLYPIDTGVLYRVGVRFAAFVGTVADYSPYYQGANALVWRVSSVEPVEAYLPQKLQTTDRLRDRRDTVVEPAVRTSTGLPTRTMGKDRFRNDASSDEGYRYGYMVQGTLSRLAIGIPDGFVPQVVANP